MKSLKDVFYNSYLLNKEKVILETHSKDSDESFTFYEFYERIKLLQNCFYYYGVKKGDSIAILAQDIPRWNIAFFAIVNMGCIVVPISKFNNKEFIHRATEATNCNLLLLQKGLISDSVFSQLREDTHLTIIDIDTRECILSPIKMFQRISTQDNIAYSLTMPKIEVNALDIAAIEVKIDHYSVHTKQYTHEELINLAKQESSKLNMTEDDTFMSIITMSYMNRKILGSIIPILTGTKTVFKPRNSSFNEIVSLISEVKPDVIFTVPKIIELVYKSDVVDEDLRSLMDIGDKKLSLLDKLKLKIQGIKIYKLLGGKLRICSLDKSSSNSKILKFLNASGLGFKINFDKM
ncbi:MAG: AMP-binding protein [Bacteroidales bacterium]|jgi:long-chain acyl-CoA synthetase